HAGFDERDVETEHGAAMEAPPDERGGNSYAHLRHRATSRLYTNVSIHGLRALMRHQERSLLELAAAAKTATGQIE
ncbi:MAG: hypothetical protein ACREVY_12525, partial [Gammaproteobacteria bacterium]